MTEVPKSEPQAIIDYIDNFEQSINQAILEKDEEKIKILNSLNSLKRTIKEYQNTQEQIDRFLKHKTEIIEQGKKFRGKLSASQLLMLEEIITMPNVSSGGGLAIFFIDELINPNDDIQDGREYTINFHGNSRADANIGLGDILDSRFKEVTVSKDGGTTWETGIRSRYKSRIGYVDQNGRYLAVHGLNSKYKFKAFENIQPETQEEYTRQRTQVDTMRSTEERERLGQYSYDSGFDDNGYEPSSNETEAQYNQATPQVLGVVENEEEIKTQYISEISQREMAAKEIIENLRLDPKNAQDKLTNLTADQVWEMRSNLGPEGMKTLMSELELDTITIEEEKLRKTINSILKEEEKPIPEGLDDVLISILNIESRRYQFAVSPTGALGPWQIIKSNYTHYNKNPFDVKQSTECAIKIFLNDYNNERLKDITILIPDNTREATQIEKAVMAYFAGAGNVIKSAGKDVPTGNLHNAITYLSKYMTEYSKTSNA